MTIHPKQIAVALLGFLCTSPLAAQPASFMQPIAGAVDSSPGKTAIQNVLARVATSWSDSLSDHSSGKLSSFLVQQSLQYWMDSPERQALLAEGEPLTLHVGSRVVQSGFSQWIPVQSGARAPAWKQNLIVLMLLYPVVFLFGLAVKTPVLMHRIGMPFWLALFFADAVSIVLLGELVPRVTRLFAWWLNPNPARSRAREAAGVATIGGVYAVCLAFFSRL